ARWDGQAWQALDDGSRPVAAPWFQDTACGDEDEFALWDASDQALAADGSRILLGGSFPGAGGVLSQSIVAREGDVWTAQGPSGLGLGGSADRVEAGGPDCELYALGGFSHAGGEAASSSLIRFDGDGWVPLGERLSQDFFCPALAVSDGGDVVIGCVAPAPEGGGGGGAILRLEGDTLRRIPAADALGPVFALAYGPDGKLWIGGAGKTGYVATLAGDELDVVEDGFDSTVSYLDVGAQDVLVAGEFTQVGDLPALRIARWDGSSWSALGEGLAGSVTALARDGDTVYVSTLDSGEGGGLLFGAFDGSTWTELAATERGLTPAPFFNFNAIRPIGGGRVLAVGSAWIDCPEFPCPIDSERGAVVWDGERFTGLAGGVRAIGVSDLALTRDAIWVGGLIAEAGDGDGLVPSAGVARFALPPP
ncbi:MAG TPA: hypothetical protein VEL05_11160, partial [Candidatus Acidoferrum sp.]|nr:hypothetical protein [Candidatus Acidoferrum sp.]